MTKEIEAGADIIDVRDVIARVEELRERLQDERETLDKAISTATEACAAADATTIDAANEALDAAVDAHNEWSASEEADELTKLETLLNELSGRGGDEQWEGDWYPSSLIRDSYFTDAMRELVQDIGDLPRDIPGYLVIDWDATVDNLRADYSSVDFDGTEYWYR